jgi:DNA (cytosine-5)-methyltransferase 1
VADTECAERRPETEGRHNDGDGHDARREEAASWPGKCRDHVICGACLTSVDLVCGGFPCQPHSLAGRRSGAQDERDLWPEFARLIRELRPRWVVAENVPGLLSIDAGRFFGGVLRDLAACGYDAEWDCLPAAAVGAPHRRDRVWIVAYPNSEGLERWPALRRDTAIERQAIKRGRTQIGGLDWWAVEPNVGRVAHGISNRVERLRGLGNAIVPQIAEWIFGQIQAYEDMRAA